MTVKELLDILNNRYEIPKPEVADICFYLKDEDGETIDLKLVGIGAFDISTDITFTFEVDDEPVIIKPVTYLKPQLRKRMEGGMP